MKLILKVAIDDSDYVISSSSEYTKCPYYIRWRNMITRCYCPKYVLKKPSYKDCSVCDEWLTFSNFKAWMIKQDWQGKHLDKDILIHGNKVYSPETCIFVTQEINTLLTDSAKSRGNYPQGVTFHDNGKYRSRCSVSGKPKHLGYFDTPEQASDVYKKFKSKLVHKTALKQCEPLRSALIRIANKLLSKEDK